MTVSCNGVTSQDRLVFNITGEACVPQIFILEPYGAGDFYDMHFLPTFYGCSTTKEIAFKNIGNIPCKVIVEICEDSLDQLSLIPTEETLPYLNLWNPRGKITSNNYFYYQ